jgi:hypothetical protein
MTAPLDDIRRHIALTLAPYPAEMRVGAAIAEWLRAQTAEPPRTEWALPPGPGAQTAEPPRTEWALPPGPAAVLGIRIVVDQDLDDGQWRFLDQFGETLGEGRVGEPGESVFYSAGQGFFAWKTEVA